MLNKFLHKNLTTDRKSNGLRQKFGGKYSKVSQSVVKQTRTKSSFKVRSNNSCKRNFNMLKLSETKYPRIILTA